MNEDEYFAFGTIVGAATGLYVGVTFKQKYWIPFLLIIAGGGLVGGLSAAALKTIIG
jgi:uncharacterized membrane protein YccC